ncbi:MAG: DUF4419 domain-containing protein [Planctomycetaceae bacterium]
MSVTFSVSPEVEPAVRLSAVDHKKLLRQSLRRPIEALWTPSHPLVACDDIHALVRAVHDSFYLHHPLILSPDVVWLTLARGFAIHVNMHSEELRNRFVAHLGKEKIVVDRRDFFPGAINPWPEAFAAFSDQVGKQVGELQKMIRCDFSTTGPNELAASDLMIMDTFQAYFEYDMRAGCGIPSVTLTGTVADWKSLQDRAGLFVEYGLRDWIQALNPILSQFVRAAEGHAETEFWKSFFRYHGGSGPAVMTGWINVLFPYLKDLGDRLYLNPYLGDWERRLEIDDKQHWRERWGDPQGVGIKAVPSGLCSAPVNVIWGDRETDMRFVGGLVGVSQTDDDLALETQCGWIVLYEKPVDPLSGEHIFIEQRKQRYRTRGE